jgi:hypothetical protein
MSRPEKQPTFLGGLVISAIPLAAALLVALIGFLFVYLFWFGTDALMDWLF